MPNIISCATLKITVINFALHVEAHHDCFVTNWIMKLMSQPLIF